MLTTLQLAKITKALGNVHRLDMLEVLSTVSDANLTEIVNELALNNKTASEHLRRLALADLITKKYHGRWVKHRLTDRALVILTFSCLPAGR